MFDILIKAQPFFCLVCFLTVHTYGSKHFLTCPPVEIWTVSFEPVTIIRLTKFDARRRSVLVVGVVRGWERMSATIRSDGLSLLHPLLRCALRSSQRTIVIGTLNQYSSKNSEKEIIRFLDGKGVC